MVVARVHVTVQTAPQSALVGKHSRDSTLLVHRNVLFGNMLAGGCQVTPTFSGLFLAWQLHLLIFSRAVLPTC